MYTALQDGFDRELNQVQSFFEIRSRVRLLVDGEVVMIPPLLTDMISTPGNDRNIGFNSSTVPSSKEHKGSQ